MQNGPSAHATWALVFFTFVIYYKMFVPQEQFHALKNCDWRMQQQQFTPKPKGEFLYFNSFGVKLIFCSMKRLRLEYSAATYFPLSCSIIDPPLTNMLFKWL